MKLTSQQRSQKLRTLADIEGTDVQSLLEEAAWDICIGICLNDSCEYTTETEPDAEGNWCEECRTHSVASCLVLAGVI